MVDASKLRPRKRLNDQKRKTYFIWIFFFISFCRKFNRSKIETIHKNTNMYITFHPKNFSFHSLSFIIYSFRDSLFLPIKLIEMITLIHRNVHFSSLLQLTDQLAQDITFHAIVPSTDYFPFSNARIVRFGILWIRA